MSPIEGVSDVVRMPRLGKIRLGIKMPGSKEKSSYPKATDYFVCPEEVQQIFGEKPTELEIMFPVEDPSQFAQQWLRCYSLTQGLVCIGNGESSRRKVDVATGDIAGRDTKQWEWRDELPCNPEECPHYGKQCRRVMNLQFLLPQVPGLGIWQIDTSSFYSIVNINSMIKMLKGILGRCSGIPLTLALGPIEVTPLGTTKKTVHVMHIKKDIRLADLAKLALLPPARVLIPEPEIEEPPEDLFPEAVLEEAEASATEDRGFPEEPPEVAPSVSEKELKERDLSTLTSFNQLCWACYEDFKMQPNEVIKESGYSKSRDITDFAQVYLQIKATRKPKG